MTETNKVEKDIVELIFHTITIDKTMVEVLETDTTIIIINIIIEKRVPTNIIFITKLIISIRDIKGIIIRVIINIMSRKTTNKTITEIIKIPIRQSLRDKTTFMRMVGIKNSKDKRRIQIEMGETKKGHSIKTIIPKIIDTIMLNTKDNINFNKAAILITKTGKV